MNQEAIGLIGIVINVILAPLVLWFIKYKTDQQKLDRDRFEAGLVREVDNIKKSVDGMQTKLLDAKDLQSIAQIAEAGLKGRQDERDRADAITAQNPMPVMAPAPIPVVVSQPAEVIVIEKAKK